MAKITKVIVITIVAAKDNQKFRQKLTKPAFIILNEDSESNIRSYKVYQVSQVYQVGTLEKLEFLD